MEYILYFAESCPDTAPFKEIRGNMKIGIPCLVISESECILEIDELTNIRK